MAALLLPAAAEAAREYDLPAQLYYEQDVSGATSVDPAGAS